LKGETVRENPTAIFIYLKELYNNYKSDREKNGKAANIQKIKKGLSTK
jgi:hypothetical protein